MAPEGYPFGRLFCVSLPNRLDFLSFALLFPYFVVNRRTGLIAQSKRDGI